MYNNARAFKQCQANYDSMEHPSYYDSDPCDCMQLTCSECEDYNTILFQVQDYQQHVARKDHYNSATGKLEVMKGWTYARRYSRTVWRDNFTGEVHTECLSNRTPIRKHGVKLEIKS